KLFLDHILDRGTAEVLEFVLQLPRGRELHAAVSTDDRVFRDWRIAHRTGDGRANGTCLGGLHLLRLQAALAGAVRFTEAGVQFRLQDPETWIIGIETGESVQGVKGGTRVVEGRLGRRHREQGVCVLRVQLEPLARYLHD